MDRFEGPAFHSARWDHDVDLSGRRVAVIGTGASAVQLIPPVAEQTGLLKIFQRTPNWFVPTPEYQQDIPAGLRWLQQRVPTYAAWYRFWLFWRNTEGMLAATEVDETWDDPRSVGPLNDLLRELLTAHLQQEFADAPELLDEVIPAYPPSAKRVIRDDGTWPATLKRDDVELITEKIEEITPGACAPPTGWSTRSTSSSTAPASRRRGSSRPCRSSAAAAWTSTSTGTVTPAPTSASTSRASPTCSACTGPTPTS
jgi:4-hydroxyacetophenone monooxygenase